jgi:hypothetical protein
VAQGESVERPARERFAAKRRGTPSEADFWSASLDLEREGAFAILRGVRNPDLHDNHRSRRGPREGEPEGAVEAFSRAFHLKTHGIRKIPVGGDDHEIVARDG